MFDFGPIFKLLGLLFELKMLIIVFGTLRGSLGDDPHQKGWYVHAYR
jgi:hypothetical protein